MKRDHEQLVLPVEHDAVASMHLNDVTDNEPTKREKKARKEPFFVGDAKPGDVLVVRGRCGRIAWRYRFGLGVAVRVWNETAGAEGEGIETWDEEERVERIVRLVP